MGGTGESLTTDYGAKILTWTSATTMPQAAAARKHPTSLVKEGSTHARGFLSYPQPVLRL